MKKLIMENDFKEYGSWFALRNLKRDNVLVECPQCSVGKVIVVLFEHKGEQEFYFCGYCNYLFEEQEVL